MGQIENMLPEDVELIKEQVEALNKAAIERTVPVTFQTFPMEDLEIAKRITTLEEKIDTILRRLDLVFGNHVLMDGKFLDTAKKI